MYTGRSLLSTNVDTAALNDDSDDVVANNFATQRFSIEAIASAAHAAQTVASAGIANDAVSARLRALMASLNAADIDDFVRM